MKPKGTVVSNNIWDGMDFNEFIKKRHNDLIGEMHLPKWVNINCPFCEEELPLRSIRSLNFHFNANDIGDVSIEVSCDKCGKSESVYFQCAFENMKDIIDLMNEQKDTSKLVKIRKDELIKSNNSNLLNKINLNSNSVGFKGE